MKNGNLYQELKSAKKKEERVTYAKKSAVISAMEKELEDATRPIKEKYEPILKALNKEESEKSSTVWHIGGIYHDYGSFVTRDITEIFAVFLSYIEGEKYIPYRNLENREINENSIIIKESVNNQYDKIDYDILDRLYENGDLIMLASGFSSMVDLYDYVVEPNYKFGKFNYLYEFTNRLIQYRMDNNISKTRPVDEVYSFMCNFILTHPELAMKNKDKRDKMLRGESDEQTLISQCKKLERKLQ